MTVVVADDSSVQINIILSMLRHFPQYTVIGSYDDGLEALESIRLLKPDLAIIDYVMPNRTGQEVVLAARAELLPTKFIIASSMGQKAAAYASGVPVLIKPYSPELLKIALYKAGAL